MFNLSHIEENFSSIEENLKAILPTGSGFDTDWHIDNLKNGNIIAKASFHCMDENGFYCGWSDFTIKFKNGNNLGDFVLSFNGKKSHYLNNRHMLRDYIETVIYEKLREFNIHDKNADSLITLF